MRLVIAFFALAVLLGACSGGSGPPNAPAVATLAASNVITTSAKLNLQVNPRGEPTEVIFFWGGDPDLAFDYAADYGDVGRGNNDIRVSVTITGLAPNTTYYFKARASNDHNRRTDGAILNFTTSDDNAIYWARSWGTEGHNDTLRSAVFTSDGGFALAGRLENSIGSELWVLKFDSSDRIQWRKTFRGAGFFEAWDLIETSDGNLLVAGSAPDPDLDTNQAEPYPILLKIDMQGNLLWARRYSQFGFFKALFETPDQGAVLFADTLIDLGGGVELDVGIYKVDRDGEVEWVRQIDSGELDFLASVKPTASGYALVGESKPLALQSVPYVPPWALEIDTAGNILWQQVYACEFRAEELQVLNSGDLLIAGEDENGGGLLQLDSKGDYRLMKTYDGDDFQSIDVDGGGNILATGCFETGPGCGIGIARLDSLGSQIWARTYAFTRRDGEPSDGGTRLIRIAPSGDLIFLGRYESRREDLDAQVMLLPPDGDLGDVDLDHILDDSLALCLQTGASPLSASNAAASAIDLPLLILPSRATAFQQAAVP